MPSAMNPATGSIDGCSLTISPQQAQPDFFLQFATRHYGSAANASVPQAVADIHSAYFKLPHMVLAYPQGDHFFGTSLRGLLGPFQQAVESHSFNPALANDAAPLLGFVARSLQPLDALFNGHVLPLQQYFPAGSPSAEVFSSHVVAQISIHYHHTLAFQALGQAAVAWSKGDVSMALTNATTALAAIDACLDFLRQGEGSGIWRGMYASETWTWVVGTRAQIAVLVAAMQGKRHPAGPADTYADNAFMVYEGCSGHTTTGCDTFPLSRFNASIAWDVMVRVACAGQDNEEVAGVTATGSAPTLRRSSRWQSEAAATAGGQCTTTVMGVSYTGPSTSVALFTPVNYAFRPWDFPSPVIRFSLDGSPVTPSSAAYTAPLSLAGNVTLRARAFDAVTGAPLASENVASVTQISA